MQQVPFLRHSYYSLVSYDDDDSYAMKHGNNLSPNNILVLFFTKPKYSEQS